MNLRTLCIVWSLAAALMAGGVLLSGAALDSGSAYAQTFAEAKKRVEKKEPASKDRPKPQERTAFTAEEEDAAVISGIPDARVWGDSDTAFARVLPQASGPWLAISGGGSDGAYGAGVLTGWTEAGTRPEFAGVAGSSVGHACGPFAVSPPP